jgi:hypothetical protein
MRSTFLIAAALGVLGSASVADAHGYRYYFKGSDAIAQQIGGPAPVLAPSPYPPPAAVGLPARAVVPAVPGPPAVALAAPVAAGAPCTNCTPGAAAARNHGAGVPNALVTFLHPYTNKAVTVPLTLPVGKPQLITKSDRIIYDYSFLAGVNPFGKRVVVGFHPDGTVSVYYHA